MERSTTHISLWDTEPHSELKLQNIGFDYAPFHKQLIILWGGALVTEIDWLYWPRKRDWIIRGKLLQSNITHVCMSPTHNKTSQRRHVKLEGRKKWKPKREHSPTTNFLVSCLQFFDVSSLANKHSVCSLLNYFCLQHEEKGWSLPRCCYPSLPLNVLLKLCICVFNWDVFKNPFDLTWKELWTFEHFHSAPLS